MSTRTENLKLRVDFRSPDTILSQRTEMDENFNLFDSDYPLIFEGLEKINEKFAQSVDLHDEPIPPVPPTPVIPEDYIELEYLSGNNQTWLDSTYLCKVNTRILTKIAYPQGQSGEKVPFGTYWWYSQFGLSVQPSSGHLNFRWHAVANNSVISATSNGGAYDAYEIECGNGYLVLEGNEISGVPMSSGFDAGPLTIGDVITGDPGTAAAASITGTSPNFILNLTIPQGPTGPAA